MYILAYERASITRIYLHQIEKNLENRICRLKQLFCQ